MSFSGTGSGWAQEGPVVDLHGARRVHTLPHRHGRQDVEQDEPLDPAGMVERQAIGDAGAAVMADHREAIEAERAHRGDDVLAHAALAVERLAAVAMWRCRPAIAAQIRADDGVRLGQLARHLVPLGMGLREAVDQHHRRSLAADAGEDLADRPVDPARFETGEETVDIGHDVALRCLRVAPHYLGRLPGPVSLRARASLPASRCRAGRSRPASRSGRRLHRPLLAPR